jgi:hypothetical protein
MNSDEMGGEEKTEETSITKPLLLELAECIVPFLISSSNSLNAHLRPTETKNIELYSAAIVYELSINYHSTVQSMYEFAHSTKKVVTSNTAVVALAVKTYYDKSTSNAQKLEEERAKVRPAVQTLKEIIRTALPYVTPIPSTQVVGPSQDGRSTQHQSQVEVLGGGSNLSEIGSAIIPRSSKQIEEMVESFEHGKDEQGSSLRKKQRLSY